MAFELKQESEIEVGDRRLTVTSVLLVEPEVMIVTRVSAGGVTLRRTHVPLPVASVRDYETRGLEALRPTLAMHHLRFVQSLLARSDDGTSTQETPARAGVLALLVLGPAGEILSRVGEDQVPGAWLRASYLVTALATSIEARFDFGALERAEIAGQGLAAVLRRADGRTSVSIVDPGALAADAFDGAGARFAELELVSR